jgi:hypothetical protein
MRRIIVILIVLIFFILVILLFVIVFRVAIFPMLDSPSQVEMFSSRGHFC